MATKASNQKTKLEDRLEAQHAAKAKLEAELEAILADGLVSRVSAKKKQKKDALLNSAYELFTTEGFSRTTIRDIAHRAGVAKGTFYLYFEDKDAVLDELTRRHASRLLTDACKFMEEHIEDTNASMNVADKFIFIIDYLIDQAVRDPELLKLLSKDLTRGLFKAAHSDSLSADSYESTGSHEINNFEAYISNMLDAAGVRLRNLRLLIFTLLDLVNSTCYDILIYKEPVSLDEYKPYLNNCIRLLVNEAIQ